MPGIRRVGGKKKQFEQILRQAALLFKEKGFHGVTMDDIAQGLGKSKLSIYYYFESKESLLFHIYDMTNKRLLQGIKRIVASKESPEMKLRLTIRNHIDIILLDLAPATTFYHQLYSLSPQNRKKVITKWRQYGLMIREIISEGIEQGVFIDCDPKLTSFLIGGALNHMINWYRPEGPLTEEQIADFFVELLIRGLLRNPPPAMQVEHISGKGGDSKRK